MLVPAYRRSNAVIRTNPDPMRGPDRPLVPYRCRGGRTALCYVPATYRTPYESDVPVSPDILPDRRGVPPHVMLLRPTRAFTGLESQFGNGYSRVTVFAAPSRGTFVSHGIFCNGPVGCTAIRSALSSLHQNLRKGLNSTRGRVCSRILWSYLPKILSESSLRVSPTSMLQLYNRIDSMFE